MFRPSTLHDAHCLAKLQEATLASLARRTRPILERGLSNVRGMGPRFGTSQAWSSSSHKIGFNTGPSRSTAASSTSSRTRAVGKTLSSKELDEKRAKNLCFLCDEKYFPGHKCRAQVYRLEVIEEEGVVWRKI